MILVSEMITFGLKRLMRIVNLGDTNSILNKFVAELRDVDIQKTAFASVAMSSVSEKSWLTRSVRNFIYSTKDIQSPLGIAPMNTPDDQIVISTILRAGLPFHQGFLRYLDKCGERFRIRLPQI